MLTRQCEPMKIPHAAEEMLMGFLDEHQGGEVLRVEHQTCSIGTPEKPLIVLSMLIHFQI